jgi:hypothetical protein
VDYLLASGYRDIGWREVSSEAFGLPNPKKHVLLVATDGLTALVDCCLFSTVCPQQDRVPACTHTFATLPCMQGLEPCPGCPDRCYQCGNKGFQAGEDGVLAWDVGEIFGLSDPSRLPAPTTVSLARTVIMRPERGSVTRINIQDAERAQGMQVGHTAVTPAEEAACDEKTNLALRFRCVGNAMPGVVRLPRPHYLHSAVHCAVPSQMICTTK